MDAHYMPFGYGARTCLGKAFADVQVKLLVAAVILNFELFPVSKEADMVQMGTQNALPVGLKCELRFARLRKRLK